jgi:hypothetical protein
MNAVFWDITPCSRLKVNRRFGGACRLHLQSLLAACFILVYCLAYSPALTMEAIYFSETSVYSQWTTGRSILEDRTNHNHRYQSLKSYEKTPWL